MAQDQSEASEGQCGVEMLAADPCSNIYLREELSEELDKRETVPCSRNTAWGEKRCRWHTNDASVTKSKQSSNFSNKILDKSIIKRLKEDTLFIETSLRYSDFSGSNMKGIKLVKSDLYRSDLSNSDFSRSKLDEVYLNYSDIISSNIKNIKIKDSYLYRTDLSDSNASMSQFYSSSLHKSDLSNMTMYLSMFKYSNLSFSTINYSDIRRAKFISCDLSNVIANETRCRNTEFISGDDNIPTNLENAVFRNADLRGADFTDARLDQIDLTGARIDAQTEFDAETIYERDEDVTSEVRDDGDDAVPPSVWVHRRLERLHEENALSSIARKFHIRKQRARKRHHATEANVGRWRKHLVAVRAAPATPTAWRDWSAYRVWLQYRTLELTMGYGEQPRRVVGMAGGVIGLWTLLYPLGNWVVPSPGSVEAAQRGLNSDVSGGTAADAAVGAAVRYPSLPNNLAAIPSYLDSLASTLADSIYFSTVTFTTLGFGDFSPVGFGRVLATVESALGVTLFAVLVFVLGRRATR